MLVQFAITPARPGPLSGWVARLLALSLLFTLVASVSPALVRGASPLPVPTQTGAHSRTHAKLVPAVGPLEGIDVSRWQATINWAQVKAAGKQFVVMKATEGTGYVDPMYATNRAGAMGVGIPMAAYHFASPDSSAGEAVQEADHYVAVAGLTAGNLLPALDLEQTGGLAPAALQVWVRAWLDEVTAKLGIRPMIYVSPSFWSSKVGNNTSIALAGYKTLWIANWGVTSPTVPANNWSGNGYTFWQYTDCGHVAGITTGCVDLDRYNGSDLTAVTYNPTFSVSANPTSQSVMRGGTTTFAISVARNEFVPPVTLSLTSSLPAGTSASFSPNPVTGSTSTLTITTSNVPTVTPPGIVTPTITGVGGGLTRTASANLTVLPAVPDPPTAPVATALDASAFVTWKAPANDGGGTIASYTVSASPGGKSCTATGAVSCVVDGLANGTAYAFTVTAKNASGSGAPSVASAPVTPAPSIPGATYIGITPQRLLSPTTLKTAVGKTVQVTGLDGIPAEAVAITGNLTVVNPSVAGYLAVTSVVPKGTPTTSTLAFPAHDNRANAVTIPLGPGGTLGITYIGKAGSSTQIVFDVTGYFLPGASGASYYGIAPSRLLNATTLKTSVARTVQVTGLAGVPADAVAITGNVTVASPAYAGHISVTRLATNSPATSTINFPAHDTRANAVTVPLGPGGRIGITYVGKAGTTTKIVFDVTGYFLPGGKGASYYGVIPNRLLNVTTIKAAVGKSVQVTGVGANPAMQIPAGAVAITGNVGVISPAYTGHLSVTSVALNSPSTSTLNFPAGDTRANAVTVLLGPGGKIGITYVGKAGTTTRVVFDLTGYFLPAGS